MTLELHPQLEKDCHLLGHFPRATVLLHRNAIVPWLILVPETSVQDLLDLPEEQLNEIMSQSREAAQTLKQLFSITKINFGAIGNMVPQLHLHVVGRTPDDQCWPKPVWGNLTGSRDYTPHDVARLMTTLSKISSASGSRFVPAAENAVHQN